jgi:DNA polymerase (family 10)
VGHPTGRIIQQRKPYALNLDKAFEEAEKHHIAMEINSFPERLDLDDVNARKAKEAGVKLTISTDAHSIEQMEFLPLGVSVARRAWLEAVDVDNTKSLEQLLTR